MLARFRWMRDLPLGVKLFACFLVGRLPVHFIRKALYRHVFHVGIGANSSIHWRTVFFAPSGVLIGENSIIGNDCFLDGRMGLSIANNVNISGHVHIFTLEHDPQSASFAAVGGPVSVGPYAYLASRCTVLPNVTIGEGAVVAAGAVVTKDVEPYTIVGGVPAKYIGPRTRDLDYTLAYHLPLQ